MKISPYESRGPGIPLEFSSPLLRSIACGDMKIGKSGTLPHLDQVYVHIHRVGYAEAVGRPDVLIQESFNIDGAITRPHGSNIILASRING